MNAIEKFFKWFLGDTKKKKKKNKKEKNRYRNYGSNNAEEYKEPISNTKLSDSWEKAIEFGIVTRQEIYAYHASADKYYASPRRSVQKDIAWKEFQNLEESITSKYVTFMKGLIRREVASLEGNVCIGSINSRNLVPFLTESKVCALTITSSYINDIYNTYIKYGEYTAANKTLPLFKTESNSCNIIPFLFGTKNISCRDNCVHIHTGSITEKQNEDSIEIPTCVCIEQIFVYQEPNGNYFLLIDVSITNFPLSIRDPYSLRNSNYTAIIGAPYKNAHPKVLENIRLKVDLYCKPLNINKISLVDIINNYKYIFNNVITHADSLLRLDNYIEYVMNNKSSNGFYGDSASIQIEEDNEISPVTDTRIGYEVHKLFMTLFVTVNVKDSKGAIKTIVKGQVELIVLENIINNTTSEEYIRKTFKELPPVTQQARLTGSFPLGKYLG